MEASIEYFSSMVQMNGCTMLRKSNEVKKDT